MNSDDIIANAIREYWRKKYPVDVIVYFYQKYEYEGDNEWEFHQELVCPENFNNCNTVIFINDFCEGQTCVKDISIVELDKITSYYANNVLKKEVTSCSRTGYTP